MAKEIWTNFRSLEKYGEEIEKIIELPDSYTLMGVKFVKPYVLMVFVNFREYPYPIRAIVFHYKTKEIVTDFSYVGIEDINNFFEYYTTLSISNEFDFAVWYQLFRYDMNTKTYSVIDLSDPEISIRAYYVIWTEDPIKAYILQPYGDYPLVIYDKANNSFTRISETNISSFSPVHLDKETNKLYYRTIYNTIREFNLTDYSYTDYNIEEYPLTFIVLKNPLRFVYINYDYKIMLFDTSTNEKTELMYIPEKIGLPFHSMYFFSDNKNKYFYIAMSSLTIYRNCYLYRYSYQTNSLTKLGLFDTIISVKGEKNPDIVVVNDYGYRGVKAFILDTKKRRFLSVCHSECDYLVQENLLEVIWNMIEKIYRVENRIRFLHTLIANKIPIIIMKTVYNQDGSVNISVLASEEDHNKIKSLGFTEV